MGPTAAATPAPRYDGVADWYDDWARADASPFMQAVEDTLRELMPYGSGLAVDVGCGTGLRRHVAEDHGYQVIGVDVSADQLRLARRGGAVLEADGRALPITDGATSVVCSVLTHTDVEDYAALVRESVRLLRPGGSFVHVGVHPCFNHPHAEPLPDGVLTHDGYTRPGWTTPADYRPGEVTRRVGVHHLPLQDLLQALLDPSTVVDRVLEAGPGQIPMILAIRLTVR